MKQISITLLLIVSLLSCDSKNKLKKETTIATTESTTILPKNSLNVGCYGFNDGKNVIELEVTENKDGVKGNLSYSLSEKDKNTGTFTGAVKENILLVSYSFQSEGLNSNRQLAFKIDGNKLIEGYGELNVDGTSFVDVSRITYTSSMPLIRGNCGK